MKYKETICVNSEFLKFADLPDSDYYVKFELAQKIVNSLSKSDLEKLFKFEVLDYRTFKFNKDPKIERDRLLELKMLNLAEKEVIEYSVEIEL